jgi:hypothetical protein
MDGAYRTLGRIRNAYQLWWVNQNGEDNWEAQGLYGRIILKWTSKEKGTSIETGFIWPRIGTRGASL